MKFGLFYELSVPRPWTRESERTVYLNALEQVRLADELGFDQVWAVEHHFLEEYSHCPAPELFLTACAMQHEEHPRRPRHRHLRPASSTTRSRSRSAPPCSTSSPAAASRSAPAAPPPGPSSAASGPTPTRRRSRGTSSCAACPRCGRRRRYGYEGEFWSMPERDDPAQGLPAAAPADVGRGDDARHRARRRRPRPRQPRAHVRSVRRAGEAHRRVPAAHPATASRSAPSSTTR